MINNENREAKSVLQFDGTFGSEHGLPSDETMAEVADLFKKFDDFTRVKIMFLLSRGEMCVEDLTSHLDMSQPAVSNHLRVLKQANLVKNRKQGKNVFYSLADSHVETILSQGLDHVLE